MRDNNENSWQHKLDAINSNLSLERDLLRSKLHQKIEELRDFKEKINKEKSLNINISREREGRIRKLESLLQEERKANGLLKLKSDALSEELRTVTAKTAQLEQENTNLMLEIKKRTGEINKLKNALLPKYGLSRVSHNLGQIDKLEGSLKETEDFYRSISDKIDKMLR